MSLPTRVEVELGCDKNNIISYKIYYYGLLFQVLYVAFLCDVDYKDDFKCNDDLSIFTNMFKSNGGSIDTRVNVEYKGSSLHYAMTIPITFFEEDLRKRLVHTVMIIHNGS